jgi:outer membrane receptor protein involved in Fe transport
MNEGFNFIEIPEWSVTNALNLDISQRLRFSYSINWNDWAYGVRPNGRLVTLPVHTLHNAGLRYKRSNYRIGFSVTNLFDLDYQMEYGYPSAGRNYSLSLEWTVF